MYKSVASLLAGRENQAQISISELSDVLKASTCQLAAQLIIFYTFNRIIYGMASCSLLHTQHSRLSSLTPALFCTWLRILCLIFFFLQNSYRSRVRCPFCLWLSTRMGREPTEMTRRSFILTGKQGGKQGKVPQFSQMI